MSQASFAEQYDKNYNDLITQSRNEHERILIHSFFKWVYFKNAMYTRLSDPIDDRDLERSIFETIGIKAGILNYIRTYKGENCSVDDEAHYVYEELKARREKNPDGDSSDILKKIKELFHETIVDFDDEYGLYLPTLEKLRTSDQR